MNAPHVDDRAEALDKVSATLKASKAMVKASDPRASSFATISGVSMSDPATSTAGGIAAWKIISGLFGVSVLASILGFLVVWPRTVREAAVRATATVLGSVFFGPFAAVAAYFKWPGMYAAGIELAQRLGAGEWSLFVGAGMVATPFICMAGLPFWWLLGGVVLYLEKRRGKDIGELARDVAADAKAVLP